ncbi:hypothetical protein F1880_002989 [Penicillium rolfsii]|nr:hypothetical protein F1880_002989 [Penicillium rolfsii]
MVRHHPDCCDCERCHPSEEVLKFLVKPKTKRPLSPELLYSRRKQQEHRVAEELRALSRQDFSTSKRVTRSESSAPAMVSDETLSVVQRIIRRFKQDQGVFFTHLEIQIMFFWHTYQALAGELIDPALPMMITGVLTPCATDMELRHQATEILRNQRNCTDQTQISELNEIVRLLAANGAEMRIWEALAHGTMFYFTESNIAIARKPSPSTSTFTSPAKETSNGSGIQTAQSSFVYEEASASPAPENMMAVDASQTEPRVEQLEKENSLLIEKVYYLEEDCVQLQEEWEKMERKLKESEAENRRLRGVLEASLQIFAEPWA